MLNRIVFALALIGLVVSMVSLNATKSAGMTKPKANVKGAGYTYDVNPSCVGTNIECQYTPTDNFCTKRNFYHTNACRYSYNPFASCSDNISNLLCEEDWTWYNSTYCRALSQASYVPYRIAGCN